MSKKIQYLFLIVLCLLLCSCKNERNNQAVQEVEDIPKMTADTTSSGATEKGSFETNTEDLLSETDKIVFPGDKIEEKTEYTSPVVTQPLEAESNKIQPKEPNIHDAETLSEDVTPWG